MNQRNRSGWFIAGQALRQLATRLLQPKSQRLRGTGPGRSREESAGLASPGQTGADATRDLTRDEASRLNFQYAPHPDGDPDPGEVVWTWVPYVENDGRGKDRPVLIVARLSAAEVVGCYLSTKERRGYVNVGTGGWDPKQRDSYLSPERLLRITHDGMRREGDALSRDRFIAAAKAIVQHWSLGN